MEAGAYIQSSIRVDDVDQAQGTLLVPNAHLFPAEKLKKVMQYRGGPVMLIGRKTKSMPKADVEFHDFYPPNEMWCGVYHAKPELIEAADLVTEMKLIKHPFKEQGIKAQKGIEY